MIYGNKGKKVRERDKETHERENLIYKKNEKQKTDSAKEGERKARKKNEIRIGKKNIRKEC